VDVSKPSEIRVNLPFRGRQLVDFLAIKKHLGIQNNTDVIRYLVHKHARALQRRDILSTQRLKDAPDRSRPAAQGKEGQKDAHGDRRRAPASDRRTATDKGDARQNARSPDLLCLDCPLPECDDRDPRCPYQQATGEREQQRARTRAYMRRTRT
jgi:hypothetical protein